MIKNLDFKPMKSNPFAYLTVKLQTRRKEKYNPKILNHKQWWKDKIFDIACLLFKSIVFKMQNIK